MILPSTSEPSSFSGLEIPYFLAGVGTALFFAMALLIPWIGLPLTVGASYLAFRAYRHRSTITAYASAILCIVWASAFLYALVALWSSGIPDLPLVLLLLGVSAVGGLLGCIGSFWLVRAIGRLRYASRT
jgi:hypothetical protein